MLQQRFIFRILLWGFAFILSQASCSTTEMDLAERISNDKATIEVLATELASAKDSPTLAQDRNISTEDDLSDDLSGTSTLIPENTNTKPPFSPTPLIDQPSGTPIATQTQTVTLTLTTQPSNTPIPTPTTLPSPTPIPPLPTATSIPWPTDIPFEDLSSVPRMPGSVLVRASDTDGCTNAIRVYYLPGPGDIHAISEWYANTMPGYGWLYDYIRDSDSGHAVFQRWKEDSSRDFPYRINVQIFDGPQNEVWLGGCPGPYKLPAARTTDIQITIIRSR